ncbi:peptidoglycan-binding protein [Streptomyces sp. NBC_00154]|uniref:L,D-transpeptidase family protein n=1 Tax=Streptomyces sp. NBC_00154 TaxID=2975670 RepID=UPI002254B1E8|nr:peptidoglycan-binding protein [Streptomyces sp. NBC_00154]MCX5315896.1 peptidoglycan-binding protein [Streptomyces sp. NBC_00154]
MKRSPRTLRTAAASTCAIAALTVFGAAQPSGIATASSDPAAATARHATTLQSNPNWPTTRSGNHGIAVTALQHLLTAHGHAVSPDGAYGPRTAAAVRAFQTRHHLKADAVAGAKTWKALVTTVRAGNHGSAVTAAQKLLTAHGHTVSPDGAFGPRTAAAVKAFQTRSHLDADGVIGPRTWNALLTTARSTQPTTPSTRPGTGTYTLKLTRNGEQPLNSRLALLRGGKVIDSYRAGSGMGSTDECRPDKGWLPSGTYKVKGHETNRGGWNYNPRVQIQGYAIQIEDKTCTPKPGGHKRVKRTQMFIHSEMLADGTQAFDNPFNGDDWWRWDNAGDYSSNGCIKLAPNDLKDLFTHLNRAGWPKNLTLHVS